jgi:hypothetical protein
MSILYLYSIFQCLSKYLKVYECILMYFNVLVVHIWCISMYICMYLNVFIVYLNIFECIHSIFECIHGIFEYI